MLYRYSAVDAEGRRVGGRMDAMNPVDLEMRLRHMGLDLVRGKPIRHRRWSGNARVPRRELINFCFQLQQLIRAGVPLLEALTDLRDSLEHPRLKEVTANLVKNIEGGHTLSQAMAAHPGLFNRVFLSLIRAGEVSGDLDRVLDNLSTSLKWEDELISHTQKLLLYPAFVSTIVLGATTFLMVYMVPQLKLFVGNLGQALPVHTRALFLVSDLLLDYWYVPLLLPGLLTVQLLYLLRNNPLARRRFDALKLRLPLVGGILRKIILSRFASTFAMLYAAGIPVLESLRTTRDVVGNRIIRGALEQTEQAIREGRNMAAAFQDTGLFPPLVVRMVRIGESTGALDTALLNISYFYNRDVQESVSRAQALIEPLLTLILGTLLGWIMLSVIGPIYDVISQLKL
ncbi:type II secretion system F family protein [Azovibrio restrictus]|uniref:type II secretion system F family protein n=1 Tax=Azovibrio restrictus TaxID=146938 RepID=UPI0026F080E4|nr:type II secretion system F family protein [Azovibrio restrictus]MDD3481561.1 type II secretion system F family protein [Azovibrio restrictus]